MNSSTNTGSSIDSCKLRIPLGKVNLKNKDIGKSYHVITDSGIIADTKENFKQSIIHDGITSNFGIEKMMISADGKYTDQYQEYLTIYLNSKMLGSDYFSGITCNNIYSLHELLLSYNQYDCKFEDFKNGTIVNIDIKTDRKLTQKAQNELFRVLRENAKPSAQIGKGYKEYRQKDNRGLQFGHRETSTIGNPFFKVYCKDIELQYNSNEFAAKFLSHCNYSDIVRFEYAMKNKKHTNHFNIADNRLHTILEIPQAKHDEMLKSVVDRHIGKLDKGGVVNDELAPVEIILINALSRGLSDTTVLQIIAELTNGMDKVNKSKYKSKLLKLYQKHIEGAPSSALTRELDNVLLDIGVAELT